MARNPPPRTPRPPAGNIRPATAPGRPATRTARSDDPTQGQSLRVKLIGCRTLEEIRDMLIEALDQMHEANIPKARSVYLYLTPTDADENPIFTRKKIPDMIIKEPPPYRSAADKYKAP